MKTRSFIQQIIFFASLFLVTLVAAQPPKSTIDNNADNLNGAWQRVYYYNGKKTTTGEPKEFVVVYDGYFSSIGQDSTGRWNNTYGGAFEISGNIMKNKLLYSSHPERIASSHWVEYELKGDTLTMKWFKKMINPQGQDITARMPKAVSKYIRAKNYSVDPK